MSAVCAADTGTSRLSRGSTADVFLSTREAGLGLENLVVGTKFLQSKGNLVHILGGLPSGGGGV